MTSNNVPIVAIATAPGRGGIGVVRVSAPDLSVFIRQFFNRELQVRHAHYLPFPDSGGQAIDEGIALFFKAGRPCLNGSCSVALRLAVT